MSTPQPGHIIKLMVTKKGTEVVFRYPTIHDTQAILDFINELSREDTFILFSGEQQTLEEEKRYLESFIKDIIAGDAVKVCAFVGEKCIGSSDLFRNKSHKLRSLHVAGFGLSLSKEYRGEGIGYELAHLAFTEGKKHIHGIKIISFSCFANNGAALNLYKKLGCQEVGRVPKMYLHRGEYVDEVILWKKM